MESIYNNPKVAELMRREREATDPEQKRIAHNEMIAAIKAIQFERGQRTKMTYRQAVA